MWKPVVNVVLALVLLGCEAGRDVDPPRWMGGRDDRWRLYVVGTVHVAPYRLALPEDVRKTLDRCRTLIVEVARPNSEQQAAVQEVMKATATNNLDLLEDALREEFLRAGAALGVPSEALRAMKVWAAHAAVGATAIAAKGFRVDYGFDVALLKHAEKSELEVVALETLPEQMSWLDSAPLSQQVEDLREMTTRIAAGVAGTQAASMFDAWQIGDERAIFDAQRASHADDSTFEAARRVLLLERNRIWADRPLL